MPDNHKNSSTNDPSGPPPETGGLETENLLRELAALQECNLGTACPICDERKDLLAAALSRLADAEREMDAARAVIATMIALAFIVGDGKIRVDQHDWGFHDVTDQFSPAEVAVLAAYDLGPSEPEPQNDLETQIREGKRWRGPFPGAKPQVGPSEPRDEA